MSPNQIGPKKKIAFVCSGGGTKAGAFHLGVALALHEYGFKFMGGINPTVSTLPQGGRQPPRKPNPMEVSMYVGSSAGSFIASYLAAGYSLENIFNSFLGKDPSETVDPSPQPLPRLTYPKMFRIRKEFAREYISGVLGIKKVVAAFMKGDWDFLVESRWLKMNGLFSTTGIEEHIREEVLLSNNFSDYLADLFIVGTQLNHSRKVVFGKYNYEPPSYDRDCIYRNDVPISQAVAASVAMPFVYAPYKIDDAHYIDGEIRDTLSTHVAADAGCDLIIASYTHQPYHLHKEVGSLTQLGVSSIIIQSIYLVIEQKINNWIRTKEEKSSAIDAVIKYCKTHGLEDTHIKRITEIMETELHHRQNIDTIWIHPRPDDHLFFTREHFSLNTQKLGDIVRSGFRATLETLRNYKFADRQTGDGVRLGGHSGGEGDARSK